jgi:hypothetical protein
LADRAVTELIDDANSGRSAELVSTARNDFSEYPKAGGTDDPQSAQRATASFPLFPCLDHEKSIWKSAGIAEQNLPEVRIHDHAGSGQAGGF